HESPRRTSPGRDPRSSTQRSDGGRRDRGEGRHLAAGCLATPGGAGQRRARRGAQGGNAEPLRGSPCRIRTGRGVRTQLLAATTRRTEGRDREEEMSDTFRSEIEIDAPPERV